MGKKGFKFWDLKKIVKQSKTYISKNTAVLFIGPKVLILLCSLHDGELINFSELHCDILELTGYQYARLSAMKS